MPPKRKAGDDTSSPTGDADGGDAGHVPIEGLDHLTWRWLDLLPEHPPTGRVFSPVGLWPLLALLADTARPEVRATLEGALGTAVPLTGTALAFLESLRDGGVGAATGVWLSRELAVAPSFTSALPAGTIERLSGDVKADEAAIRKWANKTLKGAIEDLRIGLKAKTMAYLASAVLLTLTWEENFERNEVTRKLYRTVLETGTVRASLELTTVRVGGKPGGEAGTDAHDVYLVIGRDGAAAGAVLAAGLRAIRGGVEPLSFESAQSKAKAKFPGLSINVRRSRQQHTEPWVNIRMPSFRVATDSDLDFGMCGLPNPGQVDGESDFPGVATNIPLEVDRVSQQALVEFDAVGFKAAAYTSASMPRKKKAPPRAPPVTYPEVNLNAEIDRPFGFIVLDRASEMLLFTGWVTEQEWTMGEMSESKSTDNQSASESGSNDMPKLAPLPPNDVRSKGMSSPDGEYRAIALPEDRASGSSEQPSVRRSARLRSGRGATGAAGNGAAPTAPTSAGGDSRTTKKAKKARI